MTCQVSIHSSTNIFGSYVDLLKSETQKAATQLGSRSLS